MGKTSGILPFLRVVVKVIWWAEVVIVGLAFVLMATALSTVSSAPLVNGDQNVTMQVYGFQVAYPKGTVTIANPRRLAVAATSFTMPTVGVTLFVLYQLRAMLDSMATGTPFTATNANRIGGIGTAILVGAVVQTVSSGLIGSFLADNLLIQGATVKPGIWPPVGWVFAGLLVLTLAEIFRYGVKLQEEHDTTV